MYFKNTFPFDVVIVVVLLIAYIKKFFNHMVLIKISNFSPFFQRYIHFKYIF